MKKFIVILVLLFIPFVVLADDKDVTIKEIEQVGESNVIEVDKPVIKDLKLNFNLKFRVINDSIKYKIIISNKGDKDYAIDNTSSFSNGEFIKYDYIIDSNSKILKAKSEVTMFIVITYNKKIADDKFVNGSYVEKNNLSLELSNDEIIDEPVMKFTTNPDTSTSDIIKIVVCIAIMNIILVLVLKSYKGKVFIIVMILSMPIVVYAIDKIGISVETRVEVEKTDEMEVMTCEIERELGDSIDEFRYVFSDQKILYKSGSTYGDFVNILEENNYHFSRLLIIYRIYKKEIKECINNATFVDWHKGDSNSLHEEHWNYKRNYERCLNDYMGEYEYRINIPAGIELDEPHLLEWSKPLPLLSDDEYVYIDFRCSTDY